MALPAGVTTVQLAVLPNPVGVISANIQITPSQNLIWSATGTPLSTCCNTFPMPGWVILPCVDQAGWVTADTRTGVTLWTYLVTATWTDINGSHTLNGSIQVFLDQTIDYTIGSSSGVLSVAPEYPIGGLALNGWVATYSALPSGLGQVNAGAAYIVQADDLIYVWSGSAWPVSGHGFSIVGIGATGATGPAGPANALSIGTVTSGTAAATISGTPPTQTLNLTLPVGPTGATGGVGPTGSVGATGTRGSDWFTGSGAPGTVGGAISGDFYLDTAAGNYYSYNGTSWTLKGSLVGPTGPTGASSTWHVGTGVPSSGLGSNGDMYLNSATGDIYGPKTSGAWGSIQENIVGPSAPQATSSTQGTIQLGGGDLGGSATAVTVPGKVPYFVPVTKTANYTMSGNDFVAANASGGTFTVTFPTAPADKTRVAVKKVDSSTNAVGLALGGSDVFNIASGPTSGSLTLQNQALIAQYSTSGAIWYVQSTDVPVSGLDSRYVQQASPVISGTASGAGVATAATANTLALRDANANLSAANHLEGYTTTPTAAGTTTLTVASNWLQFFTGTTTQTVTLPVASTLVLGQSWCVVNNSTGTVTVQSSGSNTVVSVTAGSQSIITCILASGTSAASWSATPPYATLAGLSSYLTTSAAASTYATLSSVVTAATASTIAERDANANIAANNILESYATTTTAAGTTTLTVSSAGQQYFTGTTTQTVTLPVTSGLTLGQSWWIVNNSTGNVTVQSSGSSSVVVVPGGSLSVVTCILTSGTTAASWSATPPWATITSLSSYLTTSSASSTYAPLASPALTGTPTVPTAAQGTTNTQIASTAYATTAALAFSLILGV